MENEQTIACMRHSLAHLLAAAVRELYPHAKPTIGPAIENGFYYDFDFGGQAPGEEDLKKIEEKMRELLPLWTAFSCKEVSADEARVYFKDNTYKCELINELENNGETITLYTSGGVPEPTGTGGAGFTDLCRGGHSENPAKDIDPHAFTLEKMAGAYWRGDEKNAMLTRIYGLAFSTKEELDAYLAQREEAKKRDHRVLGKELGIFTFDDEVGPGLPLWLPHGAILIEEIEKLAKEKEAEGGYERVRTPHIANEELYLRSGHLPYYQESMYPPMTYDGGTYYLKAMNCPHHHKIFAAVKKSYRDMPVRFAEYGTCYRHEQSGELFGLMRVRSMQMNDAHIYCTEEQFFEEFKAVIGLYLQYFTIFNIDKYVMRLSKHTKEKLGQKYINEPELWIKTEDMVRTCLVDLKVPFVEVEDEAAFYGPKIDVQIWSAIGREFTLATNQVDFAVPARFNLTYTDTDGKEKTPLCIHRAPLSTHERFIGFLIEHYAGAFPLWLSPVQIMLLPIGEKHRGYAQEVYTTLKQAGIRAVLDESDETLGKRIRAAKMQKIPYLAVIGDKEIEAGGVALESRTGAEGMISQNVLQERLIKEILERK